MGLYKASRFFSTMMQCNKRKDSAFRSHVFDRCYLLFLVQEVVATINIAAKSQVFANQFPRYRIPVLDIRGDVGPRTQHSGVPFVVIVDVLIFTLVVGLHHF